MKYRRTWIVMASLALRIPAPAIPAPAAAPKPLQKAAAE